MGGLEFREESRHFNPLAGQAFKLLTISFRLRKLNP